MSILIIDDEKNITELMKDILEDEGYSVEVAFSLLEAKNKIKETKFDIIFLDVWLPDGDGIDLLPFIQKNSPLSKVIMISGHANIPIAVKALKEGAFDFLEKPISTDNILEVIQNAYKSLRKELEYKFLKEKELKNIEIIGKSEPIQKLKEQIKKVAKTNAWVMIFGENGTGKELVAKSIHYLSDRANMPFVDINCAAIPDELIEAELFGYEKGAFSGASGRKFGKIEIANGGTLFLDEVADMSLPAQAKLLRVLEEKEFSRLGSNKKIKVDIRVISATNKDLDKEIAEGRFRQDLAYRLSVVPLYVPPLRERGEDILLLTEYFLDKVCKENKMEKPILSKEVKNALLKYKWPGNVRELKNLMERLCIFFGGEQVNLQDLPDYVRDNKIVGKIKDISIKPLKQVREEAEKELILKALDIYGKNLKDMAKALDIDLSSLYRKIKQYNIEV